MPPLNLYLKRNPMPKQSPGRTRNGASPVTKSTPDSSEKKAQKTQAESRKRAGPDGPDAEVVGNTFKRQTPSNRPL